MEITKRNLKLLNDENKFKFGYLCVKHVFQRVKSVVLQTFQNSEDRRSIEAVELVEKWLNDPKSVSVEELEDSASDASDAWAASAASAASAARAAARAASDAASAASAASDVASAASDVASAASDAAWAAASAAWTASDAWAASAARDASAAWTASDAWAASAARGARAASAAWAAEEKWQEKLLDYIFNQQELSKSLNIEKIDDPLNFVRDLMSKINYEGLKKCLGLRSLIYKHLKNEEEFQLCMDYLRSHNFFLP